MDLVGNDVPQVEKAKFALPQKERFQQMLDYLKKTPSVRDVVVSGGDLANLPIKALVGRKQAALTDDGQLEVDHDPRVTPFGRLLRKTSLDELPNFINVLKGDMHLVGPRADIAENIKYYPEHHRAKLAVRPGVTGLAQINGRGRLSFLQTNEYDLEYVRIRSLAADLRIIGKTILVTLRGDGAV